MVELPIERILGSDFDGLAPPGRVIGRSRERRDIVGYGLGRGRHRISLIAGCHADEPVGPSTLTRLVRFLVTRAERDPLLDRFRWLIVPQVNPDGAERNIGWTSRPIEIADHRGEKGPAYDPVAYLRGVVREPPGDDIEFGFPRHSTDLASRPENRAVADFLAAEAPLALHGSFHGMSFATGAWFLLEPSWIDRTREMRRTLRRKVRAMSYPVLDIDRRGEKGFHRIDPGFSTRPDSKAMAAYFRELGDDLTASKFRPSSMQLARSLGGDPLTLVPELPLFLVPSRPEGGSPSLYQPGSEGRKRLHDRLGLLAAGDDPEKARREIERLGVRPMPVRDQMRLQLAFLQAALISATAEP